MTVISSPALTRFGPVSETPVSVRRRMSIASCTEQHPPRISARSLAHGCPYQKQLYRLSCPETVVAWHRRGCRPFWTWKSRRRSGPTGSDFLKCLTEVLLVDLS